MQQYIEPLIKERKRNRRVAAEMTFAITGLEQKLPHDWQKTLKFTSFKTALFRFLARKWCNNDNVGLMSGHQIFLGLQQTCYAFSVVDGEVVRKEVTKMACHHEEADTRMMLEAA